MKTTRIRKNLYIVLFTVFAFSVFNLAVFAQDKEKDVKIKVVKENNGERVVIDTTLHISGLEDLENIEEIMELLHLKLIKYFG